MLVAIRSKNNFHYQVFLIYVFFFNKQTTHPSHPQIFFLRNVTNVIRNISVFAFVWLTLQSVCSLLLYTVNASLP